MNDNPCGSGGLTCQCGDRASYRKALSIEPDNNKVCNLGICLMKQGRLEEAKAMLQSVTPACNDNRWASDSHLKSYERAQEMLQELEASMGANGYDNVVQELRSFAIPGCDTGYDLQHSSLWQPQPALPRQPRRMARSSLDTQFSQSSVDPAMTGALLATAGFGPSKGNQAPVPSSRGVVQSHGPSTSQESWFQNGLSSSGWSDEDLDYSSPEDSNSEGLSALEQNQGYAMAGKQQQQPQQPLNWHAETLRQRLETVSVLGNAFMSRHLPVKKMDPNTETSGGIEQALSCDATPFNPAVGKEQAPVAAPLRPKSVNVSMNAPKAPPGIDRAPLTFDLTNGVRNGANGNANVISKENRVVKPPGAAASGDWTVNKPNKSTTSGMYCVNSNQESTASYCGQLTLSIRDSLIFG